MTLFRIGGVRIKVHPLLLAMSVVWIFTGYLPTALTVYAALLLHESAHIAAAAAFHEKVEELVLLPFGAAARMGDLFEQFPLREALIAAGGPIVSVLSAACAVTLRHYFPDFLPDRLREFSDYGFLIAAFNLIPALPLDGGRVLRAGIAHFAGRERATRLCAGLGVAVGTGILALGVLSFFRGEGQVLTGVLGLFLMLSALEEFRQSRFARARCLLARERARSGSETLPIRWIAVRKETSLLRAASFLKDGCYCIFRVVDEAFLPLGTVEEGVLEQNLLAGLERAEIGDFIRRD